MAEDFLHQPLGQAPDEIPPGPRGRRVLWAAAGLVLIAGGAGVLVWQGQAPSTSPPHGVVAAITPAKSAPPPPPIEAKAAVPAQPDDDATGGIRIVRPPGSTAPVGQFIAVPQEMNVALDPAPDPRLVEQSRFGPLPRRGRDGARPMSVYARPVVTEGGLPPNAPRIALMVGGMGLNPALTTNAVHDLPAAVTLGFAPYGDSLDQQVQAARSAGHEVVLQLPMEGYGDPASANMSHLLATGLEGKDLLDRLHWLMGRFSGYAGVANFLGGKFTGDEGALTPVLRDVASRGLFYLDDGTVSRGLVPAVAAGLDLPLARADATFDDAKDGTAVDALLDRLSARARDRGCAVGVANGLPATIARVAGVARSLAAKGIALVPVSACVAVTGVVGSRAQP